MAVAIAHFAKQGYTVSVPLTDSQKYDLIVEIEGVLNKVQIKTTFTKNPSGAYVVGLRTIYMGSNGKAVVKPFDP